jgi:hypothetical protein
MVVSDVKIVNLPEFIGQVTEQLKPLIEEKLMGLALDIRWQTYQMLEHGKEFSTIADDLLIERIDWDRCRIYSKVNDKVGLDIWELLDTGTGIYNPEHAGQGPGGRIVPVNLTKDKRTGMMRKIKALHFYWRTKERFYKSVRGIPAKHFFEPITEELLERMMRERLKDIPKHQPISPYRRAFSMHKKPAP